MGCEESALGIKTYGVWFGYGFRSDRKDNKGSFQVSGYETRTLFLSWELQVGFENNAILQQLIGVEIRWKIFI